MMINFTDSTVLSQNVLGPYLDRVVSPHAEDFFVDVYVGHLVSGKQFFRSMQSVVMEWGKWWHI